VLPSVNVAIALNWTGVERLAGAAAAGVTASDCSWCDPLPQLAVRTVRAITANKLYVWIYSPRLEDLARALRGGCRVIGSKLLELTNFFG
jgi:hypothetical protein